MQIDPDALGYLPILVLMAIAAAIGFILIFANFVFGAKPREKVRQHRDPYECGVPSVGNARQQFSVRYYVVGIVFLLFDVEVVFTYPWVLAYRKLLEQGPFILYEMLTFSLVLLVTYIYLLTRKGLRWD